jgi:hypothetical protein
MKAAIYYKQSKESRLKALHDNCDAVEKISYRKKFSKSEIQDLKDGLASSMIALVEIELELTDIKEEFKEKMSPIKDVIKRSVTYLSTGDREVDEPCFKFIDREEQVTGYYNEDGDLVRERPANPNEMQLTLKHKYE